MSNRFPWWGSIILAILGYTGLKYGVPKLITEDSALAPLVGLVPLLAPLLAIGFLLLAGKQLYDSDGEQHSAEPIPDQEDSED